MNTHSNRLFALLTVVVGSLSLVCTDLTPGTNQLPVASAGLCSSVPARLPLPAPGVGDPAHLSAASAAAPQDQVTGLLGALGQLIVEAELSHAAVSGSFNPVISASVAGSGFALEVCRDTIVGEVSLANQPRLRFVIGDFDGDGNTDVAVQRPGAAAWYVDLGALRRATVGVGAPIQLRLIEAAQPGAAGAARGQVDWLAQGPGAARGTRHSS
ncbi:hypothetical protein [Candidatus Thiodictyon syntrophicum]|jgi:hypothetical protein|uniref:Uncharacterized protein n=1 Tax=Candidatus Thiodictyon syntrophicum TaxID=1166950 RepID=A0A2K8U2D6_9GAMM|nr:hypothetical protein [Candidatus Thiodictyon syntrophicum]AUB79707.1 hypothetical protein THSYN_01195 [Candidatus Thiodictyon syntrophicum]